METTTTPTTSHSLSQPNGHAHAIRRELFPSPPPANLNQLVPPQYLPGGRKSLSGISVRAFVIGIALGICSLSSAQLAYFGYGLWRIPFFVATLAVFHYLEFDMTARYNPPDAKISSFLLFNNGAAYNIAHTMAILETGLRFWLRSSYKPDWLRLPFQVAMPDTLPTVPPQVPVLLGFALVLLGQSMRSLAMAHLSTNFNHIVQSTRRSDHVLITDGVYAFLRHPSYFGFFWWGLGTQLVLGNHFCLLFYAIVLWSFFNSRIRGEEQHLVAFFGQDYLTYRDKVGVWIPFIR